MKLHFFLQTTTIFLIKIYNYYFDFVLGSAPGPQLVLSAEYTTHDHREIITRAHCHDLSLDTDHFSALIKMSVRLHKAHGNANLRMMMMTKVILPSGVEED